jgi:hypothetical protein
MISSAMFVGFWTGAKSPVDQTVHKSVIEMTKEPDGNAWNMGVRNPIARWDGLCEHRLMSRPLLVSIDRKGLSILPVRAHVQHEFVVRGAFVQAGLDLFY